MTATGPANDAAGRAVLAAIDEAELLELASALVAIPSTSTLEGPAQERVAAELRALGAAVEHWEIDMVALAEHPAFSAEFERSVATGVVGRIGPDAGRSALLLDAHVDVVPPGDDRDWTAPPFKPTVRDGALYGRGACDTKGGLAAALHAMRAITRSGVRLQRPVTLTSVVGEEDGGSGTLATLLHGAEADACVVIEPTELSVVPAVAGALSFRITIRGRSAHGAMREEGVSAIEKLPVVQRALLSLEATRNDRHADPLFGWLRLPFAICAGRVAGGDWPSSEADWLVLEGRYGVSPAEQLADARAELEVAVAQAAVGDPWLADHVPSVEWWGGQFLPARTDRDAPVMALMYGAHTDVAGSPPAVRGMPYGCDMGLTTTVAGMPTVVYGPGDIRAAHRPDEHVPIAQLMTCARTLAVAMARAGRAELP